MFADEQRQRLTMGSQLEGMYGVFFHFDQELHISVIESNPQDRVNIHTFVNSCFDRMHPGSVWVLSFK